MNIISPINQLGYGLAGMNIAKYLSKEIQTSLWVIGQPQVTTQEDAEIVSSLIRNAHMPDFDAPCLRIWHQHDMSQFVGRGEKIGFPFFELNDFTDVEKHHMNNVDRLFVTSKWAKNIILNKTNLQSDKVNIVPLGVDNLLFKKSENNNDKTVFFNCGKWEIRKGHDILCDIFNKAFESSDNVELWLMTSNPFLNENQDAEWKSLYKSSKLGDKVKFIDRVQTHKEVYSIMCQTDCGIFPSRAEGWNLELLEMMSCGKHVIASNYSAHTEFCNNENSLLVDVKNTELAYDGFWFHGKLGEWASFGDKEIDNFAEHMRHIHKLKQSGDLKNNTEGEKTGKDFSWNNTITTIRETINV